MECTRIPYMVLYMYDLSIIHVRKGPLYFAGAHILLLGLGRPFCSQPFFAAMADAELDLEGAVQETCVALRQQVAAEFARCERMGDRIKQFALERDEAAKAMQQQLLEAKVGLDELLGDDENAAKNVSQNPSVIADRHRLEDRSKASEEARRDAEAAREELESMVNRFSAARERVMALNETLEHDPAKQMAYFYMPASRAGLSQPPLVCTGETG